MKLRILGLALVLVGATALAQQDQRRPRTAPASEQPQAALQAPAQQAQRPGPGPQQPQGRPSLERSLGGPSGRWWARPELVQQLGLTADQQKKMDDIFQQSRLKLIDLNAAVQKEDLIMEPLVSAAQPDEAKIVAQIERVGQARTELQKATARMLLGIRLVLTQDQWTKLKVETANNPAPRNAAPRRNPAPRPSDPPSRGQAGPPQNSGPNGG
jgi:periplasmic protein CpxP/Spy